MKANSRQVVDQTTPITVHKNFCFYEPIVPEIRTIRVLTIDSLVKTPEQYSAVARSAPDFDGEKWCKLERKIAGLALGNIESNIERLVVNPTIQRVHFTDLNHQRTQDFNAEAIVLSGTLRDFDFYKAHLFETFNEFVRTTSVPILAICGGHQMVGQAYGANVVTLDEKLPSERRVNRQVEYQYRFVTITDEADPIFANINDQPEFDRWHKYSKVLRVWQNHGLQLDRLPDGFRHLARGYLSEQQMMVRRTAEQLIYGVQFHIEKSFQDFQLDNYWAHRVESRDGRMIFENFMIEALRFLGKSDDEIFSSDSERRAKLKQLAREIDEAETEATPQSGW